MFSVLDTLWLWWTNGLVFKTEHWSFKATRFWADFFLAKIYFVWFHLSVVNIIDQVAKLIYLLFKIFLARNCRDILWLFSSFFLDQRCSTLWVSLEFCACVLATPFSFHAVFFSTIPTNSCTLLSFIHKILNGSVGRRAPGQSVFVSQLFNSCRSWFGCQKQTDHRQVWSFESIFAHCCHTSKINLNWTLLPKWLLILLTCKSVHQSHFASFSTSSTWRRQ